MIILDTNVLSETFKQNPDKNVIEWLDIQKATDLYITTITLAEMEYGMLCLPNGKRREALFEAINGSRTVEFQGRILPFDEQSSLFYGKWMAQARSSGKAVSQSDGMIAAIAIAADNCPVATRDVSPFHAMGVNVINPWKSDEILKPG